MRNINVREIYKWAKETYQDLLESNDGSTAWYTLDDYLCVAMGWQDGFDIEESDDGEGYSICIAIKHLDDMPDYAWGVMPMYSDSGDVWDTELIANDISLTDINWLVNQYNEIVAEAKHNPDLVIYDGKNPYYEGDEEDFEESLVVESASNGVYDYEEAIREDILNYIEENEISLADYNNDKDEMYEALYEDMFMEDSITGNASGSYTYSRATAAEYVKDNFELLGEAMLDFGSTGQLLVDSGAEGADVTIRCYLLGSTLQDIIDEME